MTTQFPVHNLDNAPAGSRETMASVQQRFGFLPNLIGVMAKSPAVLKGYLGLAGAFAESSFSPAEQQVVLLAASVENGCAYCVAAHSMLFEKSGGDAAALSALRKGDVVGDPQLEDLLRFTLEVVRKRGWVDEIAVRDFLRAGFTTAQVLEVVLGVTQKTLSNYINHLAGTPLDLPFSHFSWEPRHSRNGAPSAR